jgi:hypothetical protein
MQPLNRRCGQLFVELATAMESGQGDAGWAPLLDAIRDEKVYAQFPRFVAEIIVKMATEEQVRAAGEALHSSNVIPRDALADMLEVARMVRDGSLDGYDAVIERHAQGVQPKRLPFAAASLGLEVILDIAEREQVPAAQLLRLLGLTVA